MTMIARGTTIETIVRGWRRRRASESCSGVTSGSGPAAARRRRGGRGGGRGRWSWPGTLAAPRGRPPSADRPGSSWAHRRPDAAPAPELAGRASRPGSRGGRRTWPARSRGSGPRRAPPGGPPASRRRPGGSSTRPRPRWSCGRRRRPRRGRRRASGELGRAGVAVAEHEAGVPALHPVDAGGEGFEAPDGLALRERAPEAIERVRDPDQAALLADRGDRLRRGQAGRDGARQEGRR